MDNPTGFMDFDRRTAGYELASDRISHSGMFLRHLGEEQLGEQSQRCMNCGTPFCMGGWNMHDDTAAATHNGCPVHNSIPDFMEAIRRNDWAGAWRTFSITNNFPEFTGLTCPAPCENSCTLTISTHENPQPVAIKDMEYGIFQHALANGWIIPEPAAIKTGFKIAIVGSGPAGLACAQQLARSGHEVHVFEQNARLGGLLRYGIPDFKLAKELVDRRIEQMKAEGVHFHTDTKIGRDVSSASLIQNFDSVVLACGSEVPRELGASVIGRDGSDVHFAMDYLGQQNRFVSGENDGFGDRIHAREKTVILIGGGDTGADCIGTAFRQGAVKVVQIIHTPVAEGEHDRLMSWPHAHKVVGARSSSHDEGNIEQLLATAPVEIIREDGHVTGIRCARVDADRKLSSETFVVDGDMVLLAMGFKHPRHEGLVDDLGVRLTRSGTIDAKEYARTKVQMGQSVPGSGYEVPHARSYQTSHESGKVYACGDMRRGASLVVWAIREGRRTAAAIDWKLSQNVQSYAFGG